MPKRTRRSRLEPAPAGDAPPATGVDRRTFLQTSAGAAAGVAAAAGGPALAVAALGGTAATAAAAETKSKSKPPAEPVMAYVRDAKRGEVTVLSGMHETTYHDPALAKRLLDAAR
jgi:hypothetical protein